MATNLALDDELVEKAKRLGRHQSKREAVNQALAEYVARLKQKQALEVFGTLEWDDAYDYKKERRRRRRGHRAPLRPAHDRRRLRAHRRAHAAEAGSQRMMVADCAEARPPHGQSERNEV
jgi:Arc/MetJ family transcription regulator